MSSPGPFESTAGLKRRLVLAAILSVLVLIVGVLEFSGWGWVSLVIATPVVGWAGLPFHQVAWANLRLRAVTSDTLVSLAVLALFGWSLVALVVGADNYIRFAAAAVITALALAARYAAAWVLAGAGEESRRDDPPLERRVADVLPALAIGLAAVTVIVWAIADGAIDRALTAAITVLIVVSPAALRLSRPAAVYAGRRRAAQIGIQKVGPGVLEQTPQIEAVVLDGTATVTTGSMSVTAIRPTGEMSEDDVLRIAGAVEAASDHPVGRAIAAAATERGELRPVRDFRSTIGIGVSGVVDGRDVTVGRGVDRAISVIVDGDLVATIDVEDTVNPSAVEAVRGLRGLGIEPILMTDDREHLVRPVADEAGIDEIVAIVTARERAETVCRLQDAGRRVAVVANDGTDPVLAAEADLAIAIGTGADDAGVVARDLPAAVDSIRLARRTLDTVRVNLVWVYGYHMAAVPLAVAGVVPPIVAGVAMTALTLFVVANSLWLRSFR